MNRITLKEAKEIKLMNRIDKKYVIDFDQFCSLSSFIYDNFYVVENDGAIMLPYFSLYFDTPNMDMHKDHLNKKAHRQKIRIREYSTGEKYLEIKEKNNSEFTKKKRIPVQSYILNEETNWIDKNLIYDTKDLNKKLEVRFNRLTLVSLDKQSRITIDFNIRFHNYITDKSIKIKHIIVEVKKKTQELIQFEKELQKMKIESQGFSKYSIGLLLTK